MKENEAGKTTTVKVARGNLQLGRLVCEELNEGRKQNNTDI